jgi:hypothetical protein
MTTDKKKRKEMPIARGLLDYFPDACAYVAHVSYVANQQHNPGEEMHWAREKSTDHADCIGRHLTERGKVDDDGLLHSGKVAWRALAMLQLELEKTQHTPKVRRWTSPTGGEWKYENGRVSYRISAEFEWQNSACTVEDLDRSGHVKEVTE